jgi:hypothetical protein
MKLAYNHTSGSETMEQGGVLSKEQITTNRWTSTGDGDIAIITEVRYVAALTSTGSVTASSMISYSRSMF